MQDAPQDNWLTIAEAAAVLGTSPDTVRRRIRRGELVAQHHARHVRVRLDGVHSNMHGTATLHGNAVQEQSEGLLEALRIVDRLQRENRDLAGIVGSLQQRLVFADDRIRALEAPKEPASHQSPLGRDSGVEPSEPTSEPSKPKRRRWWLW